MYQRSKAAERRWRDGDFLTRYFVGEGIDVGAASDGLSRYVDLFPGLRRVRSWEAGDGDAQYLKSEADASYDFLHASHCLEHMLDPHQALQHWLRVVKPGGYLVVTVPADDSSGSEFVAPLPGPQNWSFILHQPAGSSWAPKALNVLDLLSALSGLAQVEQVRQLHPWFEGAAPAAGVVEFILRKRSAPQPSMEAESRPDLTARALRLYGLKEHEAVLDLLDNHAWLAGQSADILNAAGAAAFALKNGARAILLYQRATRQMPAHYDAWNNLGIALCQDGQLSAAEAAHREAIRLNPAQAGFKAELLKVLTRMLRFDEAKVVCLEQLEKQPESVTFLGDLGAILVRQGHQAEARATFERVLALHPDSEDVALGIGTSLMQAGYHSQAETLFRDTITRYQSELARFNLGLLLLLTGRFEEGWALYQARGVVRKRALPTYQFPLWSGEALAGKRILLTFEQGFGDEVMVCRYVALLKAAGALRVAFVCRQQMVALLTTMEGLDVVTPEHGTVMTLRDGEFDFWTLPYAIPHYLGTRADSIPAQVPYLRSLPERRAKWAPRLPGASFKVGLVWKGSTIHSADRERSLASLIQLAPLWQVPGVSFISLQKGQGEEEANRPPPQQALLHLGSEISDFADTAAIVDQLDLIIAVDTAVVHVAGALNKPCWVLLPHFATDWRWQLERSDSPWYPSLTLFRQDATGDWSTCIAAMAAALRVTVAETSAQTAAEPVEPAFKTDTAALRGRRPRHRTSAPPKRR